MKRNLIAIMLAALVPLAGCLAEESVPEEDIDDSSGEIGAYDDDGVEGEDSVFEDAPGVEGVQAAVGLSLPGTDKQSDPVPLPWTGSENREEDDEEDPFGPPILDTSSKSGDNTHGND